MAAADIQNCVDEVPPAKKFKPDDDNEFETVHKEIRDLSKFQLDRILSNNTNRKTICLQGKFESMPGAALVILEKPAFTEDTCSQEYFSPKSGLEKVFHNDIYGSYKFFPVVDLNSIKATIIHPATEKHIKKYSAFALYIVDETAEIYKEIVLPHITDEQFNLQWVYNILDHKSESDRIIFEDEDDKTGFVLLPDLKWDGTVETLYFVAVVRVCDIKSLRDLNSDHLPLLRNIRDKGAKAIESKYGLKPCQLRVYLHYLPSFYHLHVHFTNIRHDAPGITAERAHMLSTVISNIEIAPDYYQKATLTYAIKEGDSLFKKLCSKNVVLVSDEEN